MPPTLVFTDLDATLLEEDGSLSPEARDVLMELRKRDVLVIPLTSKTRRELEAWLCVLGAGDAGSFENGAGILRMGRAEILPAARPVGVLRTVLEGLRRSTGLPLLSLEEVSDAAMADLTGLNPGEAAAAREREYDLPFVVPEDAADGLAAATLPPDLRLTRGGRFWHLSGAHDKADALRLLVARLGGGATVGLGDALNDAGFLRCVDTPILVPRRAGLDGLLAAAVPAAAVAAAPGGAGWAAAVRNLGLAGEER